MVSNSANSPNLLVNNPLNQKSSKRVSNKKVFKESDRLFSLSSVTSPVSIRSDLNDEIFEQLNVSNNGSYQVVN